ncbi:lipopolysaccharide biosynthesis protein [Acetobacter farinalis]|uniref:Lipopolysaccharide biosynthesis protein n=1 Tax=Acetobacter farinalis TaxID=1260984 RepID=A0ABT3Q752_9PROT|nr:lipopolysaccharide biosynthesis protein [Acetobacter farinalis]MCX2561107.1 lipopolysaccharide biosynthesis protein [Acetobacter farinalis]
MNSQIKALFGRVFRNTGYLLSGRGAMAVLALGSTALAVRTLGLEEYGILLLMSSFVLSCAVATRFQAWQPLLQYGTSLYKAAEKKPFHTLLRHCIALDAAGAVLGLAVALFSSVWLGHLSGWAVAYGHIPLWYMSVILFMNTGCAMGVLRLANRYELAVLADTASSVVKFAGCIAGFFLSWTLRDFLVLWYGATVVAFVLDYGLAFWVMARTDKLRGFRLLNVPWLSQIRGIWRFTFSTSLDQALGRLGSRLTVLVVGAVLGPESAAIYNVTWQISDGMARPAQMLTPALYPELVALRDKRDWTSIRQVTNRILQALALFSAVVLVVATVVGPWLLHVLLTVPWTGTRTLLLLMTVTAILDLWDVPLEPLLVSLNKAHQILIGRVVTMCFSLPLLYVLATAWGMTGAGVATLLSELAIFLTRLIPYLVMNRNRMFEGKPGA